MSMDDDIIFVTAYKDIRRNEWNLFPRTTDDYIHYFYILADSIEYTLVVYIEEPILEKLLNEHTFRDNIIFKNLNDVDTFYNKFLDKEREIMNSESYKNKIPESRKYYPEHIYPEYTLINHSKINFIRHTKAEMPNYKYYAWIDFGIAQLDNGSKEANIENMPTDIAIEKLSENHILYHCVNEPPTERRTEDEMVASYDVYFLGSYFIVPKLLVENFESIWYSKLMKWQENGICDDDQNLILQIYYDIPQLFCKLCIHPLSRANWLQMFRALRRTK
jgi:hypothetical protein